MSEDTQDPPVVEPDDGKPIDPRIVDIDGVLNHKPAFTGRLWAEEMTSIGLACLERLAPPGSVYRRPFQRRPKDTSNMSEWRHVRGCLQALRADILAGRLAPPTEPATPLASSPRVGTSGKLPGWTEQFAKHFPQDEPDDSTDYPEPDWFYWMNRRYWPTWTVVPALLLKHDPRVALRAPYMNAAWCAANPDREETRVMKTVITAIFEGDIGEKEADEPFTSNRVQPVAAVTWALGLLGIEPPPELVDAAIQKKRKLAAAEAMLASGITLSPLSPPHDDEPLPPLPNKKAENRPAIAAYFALRYAGIDVSGEGGAQALGMLGGKAPNDRYLAPTGDWSVLFERFKVYADGGPGRWARVFDTIRQWASLGEPPPS